jgi:outer membrane receptor protein involved in Fe transport
MLLKWFKQPRRRSFVLPALILLLLLPPAVAPAQEAKYSVKFEQGTLEQALDILRKVTGNSIAFSKEEAKSITVQPAEYSNKTVEQILRGLVANTPFTIEKRGGAWLIKKGPGTPAQPAAPKKEPGQVTGKIIDEENGQPVAGATIRIGNKGTTTDMNGSFTVTLTKGNYTAVISYIGYGSKEVSDIEVKDNQAFELNITLKRGKGQLSAVVVKASAKKESAASLYARQKNNAAVSDGISAEQIKVTPDNNAAQVLKRISGLTVQEDKFVTVRGLSERYNNVLLNGANLPGTEPNRRNFSFDIVPTGIVDNIVVNKTATPDMPAEFAGGLVQINTRDIPVENYLTLTAGGGFNTNSTGKSFYSLKRGDKEVLGFDDGTRGWWRKDWDPDQYRLHEAAGNNIKTSEMNVRIPNNWGLRQYSYSPMQQYQLAFGRKLPLKEISSLGFTLSATYRHEENRVDQQRYQPSFYYYDNAHEYNYNTSIGAIANIGYQTKGHKIVWKNLYNRRLTHETDVNYGREFNFRVTSHEQGDDVMYYADVVLINELLHNRLEGEHTLHKHLKIDWSGDLITLNRTQPDSRSSMGYQAEGPKGYYEYVWNDAAGFITRGNAIFNSVLKERRKNAALNLSVPFQVKGMNQLIKLGYAGAFRTASFQSSALRLLSDFKGNADSVSKAVFGLADYELHSLLKPGYLTYRTVSFDGGYNGDDYTGDQQLHAAYVMGDLRFLKNFRLIGGVRMEHNRMDIVGISYNRLTGIPVDSLMRYRTTHWLPSFNLVYSLSGSMNIRLAYSKTLARADFRERAPFSYYEFRERAFYRGAVGVRDASISNWDIRYEYYPGPGEVISVSGFYKKFKDPVEQIAMFSSANQLNLFYFNLESSTSKGIEIDFRKSLGFMAPSVKWLSNLFISGNGSWMDATVNYNADALMKAAADAGASPGQGSGGSRNRPLQGLSPYAINAGIGYTGNIIGVNLAYNRFGKRIINGGFNPWQDRYENPRDVLDLQISAALLKRALQVKLNISDLLQQDYIEYQNVKTSGPQTIGGGAFLHDSVEDQVSNPNSNHDPKGTNYNKDLDFTYHKWFKGRNISMSITYNF